MAAVIAINSFIASDTFFVKIEIRITISRNGIRFSRNKFIDCTRVHA